MNIILLSGGSGKRLWPLSNEVRSKQFLKLFKKSNGEYESMVQRVYRQIKTAAPDAQITIATSKSQASSIRSQLGDAVSICVEPSRRDTFPAIVLAASFLYHEKKVSPDEVIVVCPVDPYVDDSYYSEIKNLEKEVLSGRAGLTLMGIQPTYPSEKYGYIIPEKEGKVSMVKEFKEKPDAETAKKYLEQGAVWNAGVFAFRLGYLLEIAHKTIEFTDYRDLFLKYDNLEKISFDYAVVEKEPSIQVVRYSGEWKDVGTWNMMAEVMEDKTIGDVTFDETVQNTNAINELEVPILVMGVSDMVIAASADGILISDKERSGYMKPYVDKICTDIKYAEKSWGSYKVIDVESNSISIKVRLKAGTRMSYHSHTYRDEVWTVLTGRGKTIVDGIEQEVSEGDVVTMDAGCKHTVIAYTDMIIIETQIGSEISRKDKKKYPLDIDIKEVDVFGWGS